MRSMATITLDGTSAVSQFLRAVMQQHDELEDAVRNGTGAVRDSLEGFPADVEQRAIDECRNDPIGATVLVRVLALADAMKLYRDAMVRRADSDRPWSRTSPDWIAAGEAYGKAINELVPFCRPSMRPNSAGGINTKPKRVSTDALVIELFQKEPEAIGWSYQEIADRIGRSKTAVATCKTCKGSLKVVRAGQKIEKAEAKDRRQNGK
jgi:hypothetical protein